MLGNLIDSDVLILALLIGAIIIIGTICIILTIRGDKKYKEKQLKNKEKEKEDKEKETSKPDIQISLATEDIPLFDEKEDAEMIKEEEPAYEVIDDIKLPEEEPVFIEEKIPETKKEDIEYIFEEKTPKAKKEDVEFAFEEKEDKTPKTNLDDILSEMRRDIEAQKYEKIDRYEEDQEENAVISYQELLDRKMALREEPKEEVIKEEPIKEVVTRTSYEKVEPVYEWNDTPKHFSNSEFVSPIFGRQDSSNNYPTVKKTEVTEEVRTTFVDDEDKVSKETVDLLNELREYRNNR